jgi:hypothetical protein
MASDPKSNDWLSNVQAKKETVAQRTAARWNMPGGGYDQWKKGDAQREKDLPPGAALPKGSTPGNYSPSKTPTAKKKD